MRLARFLVRHRLTILLALLPLTVAAVWIGVGIRFDFSPQAIYAGDGDLVEVAEEFRSTFGHDDAVAVVVLEATGTHGVLEGPALDWMGVFADGVSELPGVQRVSAITTVRIPDLANMRGEDIPTRRLLGPPPYDAAERESLDGVLKLYPEMGRAFLGTDRRLGAIHVHLDPAARDIEAVTAAMTALKVQAAHQPLPEGYRLRWTGLPAMRAQVVEDLATEHVSRLPFTAVVFLLVLLVAFRRLPSTLLPLLAVGVGLAWTAAALVLAGHTLNIVSNILPMILFTVGVANGVHVVNRYAEEHHRRGRTREAAGVRTVAHMSLACLLTYLTTAIGFLSLLAARSGVLRDVGWETALGLAMLYVATIVVLCGLLPFFRPHRHPTAEDAPGHSLARQVARWGYAVAQHPRPFFFGSIALIVLSLIAASGIRANCSLLETYADDHPVTENVRLVERELGGVLSIDVFLEADTPDALLMPRTIEAIGAVAEEARTHPVVLGVRSYPDLHRAVGAMLPPVEGGGEASWIQGAHALCSKIADTTSYHRYITEDAKRARVEIRVSSAGSEVLLGLVARLESQLAVSFPPTECIKARLTGDAYVYSRAMDHFIHDMLRSLIGAALVIFAVIALLFRSPRLGLISMLPNLTPLVLTLGYMGLRGYELNASTVLVFAISLGVAVDNTIHFLVRFREERALGGDLSEAIQRTLYGAGRAMVLTSILVVLGFSVLYTSDFLPTRVFAELTSITMASALLGDLLLLPACLRLFGASRQRRSPRSRRQGLAKSSAQGSWPSAQK